MNFTSMHNYYEGLVIDEVMRTLAKGDGITDQDYLEDVVCLALNQLPARYVRHDVDMAFYLTVQERQAMEESVQTAINYAVEHLKQHALSSS